MKLLLIRHAETEHNVQGLLAGSTDSKLTNHGFLQTQKLGQYLADNGYNITKVYTSDLQRARITAQAVRDLQRRPNPEYEGRTVEYTESKLLREQDFGSHELYTWNSKRGGSDKSSSIPTKPDIRDKESHTSMASRADAFLDTSLIPAIGQSALERQEIAVVSHGLFLSALWRQLLLHFRPLSITIATEPNASGNWRSLEQLPAWSNTGYLELEIDASTGGEIAPSTPNIDSDNVKKIYPWTMLIRKINSTDHLKSLKRTRGGVGSSTYDSRQQKLDGFFSKKQKIAE